MKINEIIETPPTKKPVRQNLLVKDKIDYKFIETNCSDILKVYRKYKNVFYHGDKKNLKNKIFKTPINRIPVDTEPKMQKEIDYRLKAAGFIALRSNSVFATSSFGDAWTYGSVSGSLYVIFPLNGFDWTTSNKLSDFYYDLVDSGFGYEVEDNFVKKYRFQNTNIATPLKNGNEIYIHGRYILLTTEDSEKYLKF